MSGLILKSEGGLISVHCLVIDGIAFIRLIASGQHILNGKRKLPQALPKQLRKVLRPKTEDILLKIKATSAKNVMVLPTTRM